MQRAPLALCAATLLSLTALTACGGGTGSAPAADKPGATASPVQRVTPAERLAKLMVTKADVPGMEVKPPGKQDDEYLFAKSPDDVTTDRTACTPLALAMNQLAFDGSRADLTHHIPENQRFTYITLMVFGSPGKAESAFAGLSEGVEACGDGFTAKARSTVAYDSVTAERPVTPGGDQSLAFRATTPFRGITHTMHAQAVRSGDVVAVYFAADGMAMVQDRPGDAKLPAAVVKAQNAKLG
ncbi:hypothetical protein [Streptomyces sp. NPDC058735]|uniref:hypothetical protein n=1 Tax=unclassified Streptomyces TaxID=2593676 RepID=UPI00368216FF